ncbi:hypothetical protein [Haladaptatus pallidirubidus]|uniref:Tat (Twin-arginine translocation) pathway signal sequence n=1 Tax=Haladaptatus pallidirubidus TaxID=1008152 RepID=A0AAV3UM54_9EURY|nr:hypothetical protein [Haladaptatus pallidirubidus]
MITDEFRNRRNILKITGASIGLLGGVSSTVAASGPASNETNNTEGITWKVVRETEQSTLVMVANVDDPETNEKGVYLFQVDKENRTVSLVDKAASEQGLTAPSKNSVGIQTHEAWVEDWEFVVNDVGNCSGYVYNDHLVGGLAIESGESLNTHQGELSGLIGALVGARVGGVWGAALGGLLGIGINSAFFSHVDLSGRYITLLMWDDHVGVLNEEAVRYGVFPGYHAGAAPSWAVHSKKVSGPHIEVGEAIVDYL